MTTCLLAIAGLVLLAIVSLLYLLWVCDKQIDDFDDSDMGV